jgi:hypothetical protein
MERLVVRWQCAPQRSGLFAAVRLTINTSTIHGPVAISASKYLSLALWPVDHFEQD